MAALFVTQCGGLAMWNGQRYVMLTDSHCEEIKAGDEVPEEWAVLPANDEAEALIPTGDHQCKNCWSSC